MSKIETERVPVSEQKNLYRMNGSPIWQLRCLEKTAQTNGVRSFPGKHECNALVEKSDALEKQERITNVDVNTRYASQYQEILQMIQEMLDRDGGEFDMFETERYWEEE